MTALSSRAVRMLSGAVLQCGLALLGLAVAELGARLATGGPHGLFLGFFPGRQGLYPENEVLRMRGAVDWIVRTNRWGFRGGELELQKAAGVTRLALVGDSVTDGFLVENENTYPAFTAARLHEAGARAEVINAGYGGGSIHKQLAILREAVTRFAPDVVVVTFVTNDLHGLVEIEDRSLLEARLDRGTLPRGALRAAVVGTALGEWLFDASLRWRSADYAANPARAREDRPPGPERYVVPGGGDFARNARLFMEAHVGDARLLTDPLSPETESGLANYLRAWDAFVAHARGHGMRPVFAYFPAYASVYDPGLPALVRDRLRAHCDRLAVPFLDLTPALRAQGDLVLHLAPVDYHLNPTGNRVIGSALADFLIERGLVAAAPASGG